jgi:hypothetical protein
MNITIDNEKMEDVEVNTGSYLPMITFDNRDYYVAESTEAAGEAARQYWKELAESDPKEFACMVGEETLVNWALGQYAGPSSTQVKSLDEWLDLWLDTPEEEFAGYDGEEVEVNDADNELIEELGFTPTVAYRHN